MENLNLLEKFVQIATFLIVGGCIIGSILFLAFQLIKPKSK